MSEAEVARRITFRLGFESGGVDMAVGGGIVGVGVGEGERVMVSR